MFNATRGGGLRCNKNALTAAINNGAGGIYHMDFKAFLVKMGSMTLKSSMY